MALLLGIDTGGTFTDAVLVDDARDDHIVAHAKAPTTHHDLTIGLAASVAAVLGKVSTGAASSVSLVSVSTTLATNALVEGHGEPAALFAFGFTPRELERTGLSAAVENELLVTFDGGHDAHGNERSGFDPAAIEAAARRLAPQVSAFAVAAQFSVRNPAHELAAAELIRSATGRPVTSSHELSARLDGPRRALTAALNARLLGTIDRLNRSVRSVLADHAIEAPLMVVRGDGSLVSAAFAGQRPIETVLSGPAASVIGALHLAEVRDGLVVDIGGTTTDVAVVVDGRPSVTDGGAVVGSHRTMVEAVDMATIGLGGDSEVRIDPRDIAGPILLGPERAIPMCRLAIDFPAVHEVLDRQLGAPLGLTTHGRMLVSTVPSELALTDEREIEVLARLSNGPLTQTEAAPTNLAARAVARLQARGLVRVATMTPTDAAAVLGGFEAAEAVDQNMIATVDVEAAHKIAAILARQTASNGSVLAPDGPELARRVIDHLVRRSSEFVLRIALQADGVQAPEHDALIAASLDRHRGAAAVSVSLPAPLTAIGAPADAYCELIARLAGTTHVVPQYAEVANAVGAVVGQVCVRRSATITQPTRGQYRVHLDDQPTFGSVENARERATELLSANVLGDAQEAGAATPELTSYWDERIAVIDGKELFVEGTLTLEASGRPRF